MTKEQMYNSQMIELGIYDAAFEPAIHALAIQERELSRTLKMWKATVPKDQAPSPLNPLYAVIQAQRRDISSLRNALGLTPNGLQKLRGKSTGESPEAAKTGITARLDALVERVSRYE